MWLRGAAGEPGYLTGKDAEAAACDAVAEPVVTGHADMRVVDKIIAPGAGRGRPHPGRRRPRPGRPDGDGGGGAGPDDSHHRPGVSPRRRSPRRVPRPQPRPPAVHPRRDAGAALRHRPAGHQLRLRPGRHRRLAAHHPARPPVQHPVAAAGHRLLRLHPGQHPPRRPAPRPRLRLAPLRKARRLVRRAPPAAQGDGGKTAVSDCVLLCQFHHDICIHRRGWRLILHPDGTTTAYGPDGQVLHSHSPPTTRAG